MTDFVPFQIVDFERLNYLFIKTNFFNMFLYISLFRVNHYIEFTNIIQNYKVTKI